MKGWYVVYSEDTEDYATKRDALKRAYSIYKAGLDDDVFIIPYNDNNSDGYFAGENTIFIKNI